MTRVTIFVECCDKLLLTWDHHNSSSVFSVTPSHSAVSYSNGSHNLYYDSSTGHWSLSDTGAVVDNVTRPHDQCPEEAGVVTTHQPDQTISVACYQDPRVQQLQYLELNKTDVLETERTSNDNFNDKPVENIFIVDEEEANSGSEKKNETSVKSEQTTTTSKPIEKQNLTTSTTITTSSTSSTVTSSVSGLVSEDPAAAGVQCYSCGSLFSSVSSECAEFDPSEEDQRVRCEPGQACLFYSWRVNTSNTGEIMLTIKITRLD